MEAETRGFLAGRDLRDDKWEAICPWIQGAQPGAVCLSSHIMIRGTVHLAVCPLGLDCADWTQPNHQQTLNLLGSKRVRVTRQTGLTPYSREVCHSAGPMRPEPFASQNRE